VTIELDKKTTYKYLERDKYIFIVSVLCVLRTWKSLILSANMKLLS